MDTKSKPEKNKPKKALVLAGGGAKGAFAFGCLQAFKEKDIDFDAISGTSVGALNAILFASNSMQEGEEVWQNLAFSRTLMPKLARIPLLGKSAIKWFSIVWVFLVSLYLAMRGKPLPKELQELYKTAAFILCITPPLISWQYVDIYPVNFVEQLVIGIFAMAFLVLAFRLTHTALKTGDDFEKCLAVSANMLMPMTAIIVNTADFLHLGSIVFLWSYFCLLIY